MYKTFKCPEKFLSGREMSGPGLFMPRRYHYVRIKVWDCDVEDVLVEDVSIRELVSEEEWDEIRARARADVPAINVSAYYPASDQFAEWLLSKIGDRLREIE